MDKSIVCQAGFSTVPVFPPLWEIPSMTDQKEMLRSRVRERLKVTGKSPHGISRAIGANPGYVRDLLDPEKSSIPAADRLQALAQELETTTDYLMGRASVSDPVRSEVALADRRLDWGGVPPAEPGIPLVGTGDCADLDVVDSAGTHVMIERSSFDPDFHVTYVHRPKALTGDRAAYAIYFHGSSMEPRFFAGEIGIVQPSRPAAPGDYVVVQLNNGETDDVITVLVKRLVRRTSAEVVLSQHNPELTFSVPAHCVARIHRIMPPSEQLLR